MKIIKRRLACLKQTLTANAGMTLIEIMIVITIIAIISALVVPNIMEGPKKARAAAAKQQIQNFDMALAQYNMEKGNYPSTNEGLDALVTEGVMKKIPLDPWGNPYQYACPGNNDNDYDIWSYGADGKEGGEGYDADVSNWD